MIRNDIKTQINYQQKNYESAVKKYQESQKLSSNKQLRSASNHNIGNTYLEQKKWDEAIGYFKEALRQNPNAADSRYNLAYAMAMKKKEEQQKQNQQNKDQKNKDQQNKDQQNKDQQQKDQQNKDQQKPNEPKPDNQPENQDEQGDPQKQNEQKQDQQPQPMPSKLSKAQVDQILNALNQEEKKLKEKKEKGKGQAVRLEKDW